MSTPKPVAKKENQNLKRFELVLNSAEQTFRKGKYKEATEQLVPLLIREKEMNEAHKRRSFLLKARIELAHSRDENVTLWLSKLHKVAPEYKFDPLQDPPALIEKWNTIALNSL